MWVPSTMRSGDDHQEEDNMTSSTTLDLNNFPNDQFSTDHGAQQILLDHHSSSSNSSAGGHEVMRIRKKSGGGKVDVKDEKVYECRFCSLKFCKSQALGGHMNRHRQERETETLNRARQLVFSSDNLAAAAAQGHLGYPTNMVDPTAALHQFRPTATTTTTTATTLYPPRMLSSSASVSPALIPASPPAQPPLSRLYPISDYCVGHVLRGGTTAPNLTYIGDSPSSGSYTCIGAPVGQGFAAGPSQMGTRFGHHHHHQ